MTNREQAESTTLDPTADEVPLRRNRGFQLLWTGSAFSVLGLEIADLVFPLIVLAVTGSPAAAGAVGAVQLFTALLVGLPAGELTDRFDRRRLLLTVEALRALSFASVAVAVAVDRLGLPHLLAVSVIMGALRPVSAASRMLLLRALVPRRQLTAALTTDEVRSHGASLAGPPLGGLLYAVASVVPFLATTLTSVLSTVCLLFIRPPAARRGGGPASEASVVRRMLAGVGVVWRRPVLRRTTLFTAAMNTATAPLALVTVVHLQQQGTSPALIGVATAALALGGLAGAALVAPLHRFPPGVLMLGQSAIVAVLIALLGLPLGPWWAAAVLFLLMLGVPTMRVLVDLVMFRQVADEQRGRVMTAAFTLWGLGSSVGTFLIGVLLEIASVRNALLAVGAAVAVVFLAGLLSRDFRGTAWPAENA